jgi:hypothetical protein
MTTTPDPIITSLAAADPTDGEYGYCTLCRTRPDCPVHGDPA